MNILLVIESKHVGNTLKIAQAMAENAPVTVVNTKKAHELDLSKYNIIGMGSGIYAGKHDGRILKFADSLKDSTASTFIVTTSGGDDFDKSNRKLIEILKSNNKKILGVFSCKALDKFFFLRLAGGINKGLPNETDFKNAKHFIQNVISAYNNSDS